MRYAKSAHYTRHRQLSSPPEVGISGTYVLGRVGDLLERLQRLEAHGPQRLEHVIQRLQH